MVYCIYRSCGHCYIDRLILNDEEYFFSISLFVFSEDDDEPSVSSVTPQQHSNPISKPHVPSGAIATPNVSSRGEKSKFSDKSDGVAPQSTPSSQPSGILDSLLRYQRLVFF